MNEYIFKIGDVPNKYQAEIFFGYGICNFMIMIIFFMVVICGIYFICERLSDLNITPFKMAVFFSISFLVLAVVTQQQTKRDLLEEIPLELYKEMTTMGHAQNSNLQSMISIAKKDKMISYMEYYIIKNKYDLDLAHKNEIAMNQTLIDEKEQFLK